MKKILLSLLLLMSLTPCLAQRENPKREFRGAWLHVIGQVNYASKTTEQNKQFLRSELDKLAAAGCNAVIFQVRPSADALYESDIEDWSRFLSGTRGKAPSPLWDPLEFITEEAHKRGMEIHAWLNPYRVTTQAKDVLPSDHLYYKHPERFVRYNGQILFNPAYEENMQLIADVVADITRRYDIDAIHMDDYFYPYPAANQKFQDDAEYARWGAGMSKGDWRRDNVNRLIKLLHDTIKQEKPWVRFGISPFGIYRNKRTDPKGSDSKGLQNYDDLYADILLWAKNGWVDYLAPQLYWELDTEAAPSRKLAQWWNDNAYGVDVYIGQDTKRTMDKADARTGERSELNTKLKLSRSLPNVGGNVWWHGYWITDNYKGVADSLAAGFQSTIALPPAYGDKSVRPAKPEGIHIIKEHDGIYLTWNPAKHGSKQKAEDVVRYVVYEFYPDEDVDIDDSQAIVCVSPCHKVKVADRQSEEGIAGMTFAVTALDRLNRESPPTYYNHK